MENQLKLYGLWSFKDKISRDYRPRRRIPRDSEVLAMVQASCSRVLSCWARSIHGRWHRLPSGLKLWGRFPDNILKQCRVRLALVLLREVTQMASDQPWCLCLASPALLFQKVSVFKCLHATSIHGDVAGFMLYMAAWQVPKSVFLLVWHVVKK